MIKRPVVRWHGGKYRLASWIISHFPPHRVYTEAYGGGASVLMRKPRVYAEIYNDMDAEVVNVFRVLQDPRRAAEFERKMRVTPFARLEFKLSYEASQDPVEQARRTVIRSFMGYGSSAVSRPASRAKNGLRIRLHPEKMSSSTGFRSKPHDSHCTPVSDWVAWPDAIRAFTRRLSGVVIENRSAIDVIRLHDREETLHYVDPPYVHSTRSGRNEYKFEMTDADHRDLARVLHRCKGMVVISGYGSDLYDELYGAWRSVRRETTIDGGKKRVEVLWMNGRAARGNK